MYFHVWFVTKYRKPYLVGKTEQNIKQVFGECIGRHDYKVLELETNIDHVHLLVEVGSREELSGLVRTLKCVSAKEIHQTPRFRMGNLGFCRRKPAEAWNFWARRFGFRKLSIAEVPVIREYVRNQKIIDKK